MKFDHPARIMDWGPDIVSASNGRVPQERARRTADRIRFQTQNETEEYGRIAYNLRYERELALSHPDAYKSRMDGQTRRWAAVTQWRKEEKEKPLAKERITLILVLVTCAILTVLGCFSFRCD